MTHAEPASNLDGRWMHDNYEPVIWGNSGQRWDLLQLEPHGPSDGSDQSCQRIASLLSEEQPRCLRLISWTSAASPELRPAARLCRCRSIPMAAPGH